MRRQLLILACAAACISEITGAPCVDDSQCPSGQFCHAEKCRLGSSPIDGGSGGGSGGGGGGGGGFSTVEGVGTCSDGVDNDNDNDTDCADIDCDGRECRPLAGSCDVAESCSAGMCPTDALLQSNVVCRPDAGPCDLEERCDGVAAACPDDLFLSAVICRPARDGGCDLAEQCAGDSVLCPVDDFVAAGTACRVKAGLCDLADVCPGDGGPCPDLVAPNGQVCRADAGACDLAERCNGTAKTCPANTFIGAGTVCRPSGGGCDFDEACPGNDAGCPPDVNTCSGSQYCSGSACVNKRDAGVGCTDPAQCLSGNCVDTVCCDLPCAGDCKSCFTGTCVNSTLNTDPAGECDDYLCDGAGACRTSCAGACTSSTSGCAATAACVGSACVPDKANGQPCTNACECTSNVCAIYFRDTDGDDAGAADAGATRFCGSTRPIGYSTGNNDCCDTDPNAKPGQFTAYSGQRSGCGGWDYNCDTFETQEYPFGGACVTSGSCGTQNQDCSEDTGYQDDPPPACGQGGTFYVSCLSVQSCGGSCGADCIRCTSIGTPRTQKCR